VSKYLLIASRDPFEANDVPQFYELAKNLGSNGDEVTLFLVQNGVLPARKSTQSAQLSELAKSGVKVLADEFSLRERGISNGRIAEGIESAPLDVVIDQLEEGAKALWN
jgi:predicted peroxiredoxin